MTRAAYDTALFDIDGTLADPGDGIIAAAQHALRQAGIDEHDPAASSAHRWSIPCGTTTA